jgi:hypothetical protein
MDKKPSGKNLPRKGDGESASISSLASDQAKYGGVSYGVSSGKKTSPRADPGLTSNNAYQATTGCNSIGGDKLKSQSSVGHETSLELKQPASPSVKDSRSSVSKKMNMMQQNQNTKRKRPKDEIEKPKRPRTAYNYFVRDERKRIMEHHRQSQALHLTNKNMSTSGEKISGEESDDPISFENIGKTIGERWKNISPDMRTHYDAIAREDGRRYQRDMALYNAALDSSMEPRLSKPGSALLAYPRVGDQHQVAGGGGDMPMRPSSGGVPPSVQAPFESAISNMQQQMNKSFSQANSAGNGQDLQATLMAALQQQQGNHQLQQQHHQVQPNLLMWQLQANLQQQQQPPGNLGNLLSQLSQAEQDEGQAPQEPNLFGTFRNGANGLLPQIAHLMNALAARNGRLGGSAGGGLVGQGQQASFQPQMDQQNAAMSQQMQASGCAGLGSGQQQHADQNNSDGGRSVSALTQNTLNLPQGLSELVNVLQNQQRAAPSATSVSQQQVSGAQSELMNIILQQQQRAAPAVSSNQQVQVNGAETQIDPQQLQQLQNVIGSAGNTDSALQQIVSQMQGLQQNQQQHQVHQQVRVHQVQLHAQQQQQHQAQQQTQQQFIALQQLQQMQHQLQRQASAQSQPHTQQGGAHSSAQQQAAGLLMQALSSIPAGGGNNNTGASSNAFAAPQQQQQQTHQQQQDGQSVPNLLHQLSQQTQR